MSILAVDIGGTNSRFSIFSLAGSSLNAEDSLWLKTADYHSFEHLIKAVVTSKLSGRLQDVNVVSCAAAGPVIDEKYCKPPNIDWDIDKSVLDKYFPKSKNFLINDFLAQSFAIFTPLRSQAKIIKPGSEKIGVCGIVGPGTGLGKSYLSKNPKGIIIGFPSEGGHANFPFVTATEIEVGEFFKNKLEVSEISCEHFLCGRALQYFYQFFYQAEISVAEVSLKIKEGSAVAVREFYSRCLARVCKNFALDVLAEGGIFIAGGVLAKTPELIDNGLFIEEFCNSSTQFDLLNSIKVESFSNEDSGLWGAAVYGMQKTKEST